MMPGITALPEDHEEAVKALRRGEPYLPVTSKGGSYDDASYYAGYEMGRLDAWLADLPADKRDVQMIIRADNRNQAILLATKYGFIAAFWPCTPGDSPIFNSSFTRVDTYNHLHSCHMPTPTNSPVTNEKE